jgi:phospholipase C
MRTLQHSRYGIGLCLAALLAGCAGAQSPAGSVNAIPQLSRMAPATQSPIQHIVVLVEEGRSFNDFFVTTKVGMGLVGHGKHARTVPIKLKEVGLSANGPRYTDYFAYLRSYRKGHMDGFNLSEGLAAYQYVDPADIKAYITMAGQYGLADHMFQTQGSGDFTAHQDLIRGGTEISSKASVIDFPSSAPWGCDAPPQTVTNLITTDLQYEPLAGPFPCFTYRTLQTLLDKSSISWKCYTPPPRGTGGYWDPFVAIKAVWDNPKERQRHISSPETNVLKDIADGTLPAMSWVIPSLADSDRSAGGRDGGPAWVATVVDAIGQTKYWNSSAVVVVWDDWGGYYDPVAPAKLDNQGGPGFRVPMIVVSPYVPQGEVSHTVYGFGSIVRFIEDNWKLGRLGTTDETSKSIADMFNFQQAPRQFILIKP